MQIDMFLEQFKVLSPNVSNDRWAKARIVKGQKRAIWTYLNSTGRLIFLPCVVTLTRHGVKELDYDNLVGSFKHVRDAVADYIHPGLKPGQADDDPNITWVYAQVKCHRDKCGVQLRIV